MPDIVVLPVLATIASERKFLAALSGECLWLLILRVFALSCLVGASRSLLKSLENACSHNSLHAETKHHKHDTVSVA